MWQRRTFHECADELEQVSKNFRTAYNNSYGIDQQKRKEILNESSTKGIEILQILALSIRSEQDYDQEFKNATHNITVGALKSEANNNEFFDMVKSYRPPYNQVTNFKQLSLREALNKIAHVNQDQTNFFANDIIHDLILFGKDFKGKTWIAIISINELCRAVKQLPDQNV